MYTGRFGIEDWESWQGNCYEAAIALLSVNRDATLVHGRPLGQGPLSGRRLDHAWIERGDLVFDLTFDGGHRGLPRLLYYAVGRIEPEECRRFEYMEAISMLVRHKHYGPWDASSAGCARLPNRRAGRQASKRRGERRGRFTSGKEDSPRRRTLRRSPSTGSKAR